MRQNEQSVGSLPHRTKQSRFDRIAVSLRPLPLGSIALGAVGHPSDSPDLAKIERLSH